MPNQANERLNLYTIDAGYVDCLREAEIGKRGFSRMPDLSFPIGRKPKVLFGICLNLEGAGLHSYHVPIISYGIQKHDNFLIALENRQIAGSLRFNCMFPAPFDLLAVRRISDDPDILKSLEISPSDSQTTSR